MYEEKTTIIFSLYKNSAQVFGIHQAKQCLREEIASSLYSSQRHLVSVAKFGIICMGIERKGSFRIIRAEHARGGHAFNTAGALFPCEPLYCPYDQTYEIDKDYREQDYVDAEW